MKKKLQSCYPRVTYFMPYIKYLINFICEKIFVKTIFLKVSHFKLTLPPYATHPSDC